MRNSWPTPANLSPAARPIRNIRKITRTMELIATPRFKKALDRAIEAEAYTRKIAELAADLSAAATTHHAIRCCRSASRSRTCLLLVIGSNRGLCGGYNAGDPARGQPAHPPD